MALHQIEKLIYVKTAAQILACTEKHIYEMVKAGLIEAVRIGVRGMRVKKKSVEAFIEQNRIDPDDYYK